MDILLQILGYVLTPITAVVGWFAGRRARNNDMLNRMQGTIDMLVEKNARLIEEITELRAENAELKAGQEQLKRQLRSLDKRYNTRKCNTKNVKTEIHK